MKTQNKFIWIIALSALIGCDTDETKKGRFLLKGNEKLEENDPKSAIAFYNEAISMDSTYADAYFNKAMAHLRLNELEESIADLSLAIKFNPEYYEAAFILKIVKWIIILVIISLLIKPISYLVVLLILFGIWIKDKIKRRRDEK